MYIPRPRSRLQTVTSKWNKQYKQNKESPGSGDGGHPAVDTSHRCANPPTASCTGRLGIGPPSTHSEAALALVASEWMADYLVAWCLRASQCSAASDPGVALRPAVGGGCTPAGGETAGGICGGGDPWSVTGAGGALSLALALPPPAPLAPIGRRSVPGGTRGVGCVITTTAPCPWPGAQINKGEIRIPSAIFPKSHTYVYMHDRMIVCTPSTGGL